MTTLNKTLCLTVLAASAVLSACGGGGGGDKQDDSWIGKPTTNVPTTNKGGTGNGGTTNGGGTPTPDSGGNKDGGGKPATGGDGGGTPTTGGDGGGKPTPGGDGGDSGGKPTPGGDGGDSGGKPTPGGDGGDSGGKPTPGGDGGDSGGKPTPGGDGDGGETVKDSNTIPITVEQYGPPIGYNVNQPYVSITLCPPGSKDPTECKTIDHMLLDTGSVGVRVIASQIPAALQAKLPAQTGATNDLTGKAPLAECALFGSGFTWGSIKQADVLMGDKKAPALPIQIVSDPDLSTVPTTCTSRGGPNIGSVDGIIANGVVGIGHTARDSAVNYYYCPSATSCTTATVAATSQVMHPVMAFATDNNGTIIRLPAVPATGQAKVTGELVFGIGTRTNNALPAAAAIIPVDAYGRYMTTYNGIARRSLIDSGTNTLVFVDATIPVKPNGFYEPLTPATLITQMAAQSSGTTVQKEVKFTIENSTTLFATGNTAFSSLGLYSSVASAWGLPFFFGRDVYTVVDTAKIGGLAGPFVAF
ncbi:DUF3443 family protein [Paraburkholderia bonniea]|uniref:DUF3443 family protein n=1 Tax=Paraburkholderia bonniea TaxID=2152891 RepID=UPI001580C60E|nr:DUF3443 family protein [Paraburkholderia bonniea]